MHANENIDPAEVAKFEALAARWWDPNGEFKSLHDINPIRLEFIDRRGALHGKRVIDIGCGGGILAESMAARGADVTGIDMGQAPLSVARLHLKESGLSVSYLHATAEQIAAEKPGEYDVVTCMELLEHVPDPGSAVQACAALVKPGGHLFFSTLNRNPKSWLFAILGAEYVLGLLPKGTHEYEKLIKPSELENWARTAGLSVRELTGMHYNPITQRYWLAPGLDVNYLAHATKT
ncbi:MAG: bifunctional 2-polyprenyl-6-hydroxyphenol methylase/3-demethylubiquinol 3-O-methyltransferase UbiG [Gammaproteobacteria bacterium]|nr:bifunctional 2-polyprenyl-6-hydroxyphenol methylase/3-demethylubiquinol 3-O-methyltransferase UbiG [Gammaproteobacteria bacterium]MDH3380472.1 bifunctional 2-polyprenyl-6-hydroxyphenol methylase/3-demethylubiquinol 3-O-methyltransferase UbiG [Gammaproteobacteria bacterium]